MFFPGSFSLFMHFLRCALFWWIKWNFSSTFADFGVLDSLLALQGLFCISVRVALVWIRYATASAVSFFLLLLVGLLAIFATMSFSIFFLDGPPLVFSALLHFVFWGLCCAAFKQAARFDVFSLVVVPPQGFLFCLLFFVKSFDKFWRFSRPRVSTKFDCPNTSRRYSSVNASLLLGDLFRIDGIQPSLESSDLLPQ